MKRLQEAIASSIEGMSSAQLAWHPQGKWSSVEILEHLYLGYQGTLRGCERSLETGSATTAASGFKQWLLTQVVVEVGYMPPGRQAPERTRPKGTPALEVVTGIGSLIAAVDEALGRYEERFGKTARLLKHPVLGPLTAWQWRKFHWVHGRHHVRQILRRRSQSAGRPAVTSGQPG